MCRAACSDLSSTYSPSPNLLRATGKAGNGKRDGSGNGKRERKREQEIKRVDHISHIEREVCAYVRAQMQWISAVRLLYESSYGLEASCFG